MKFLLITVLLTVITARNGFREAYSSAPDPGSMGRVVSTDTSIIVSTFARATAGHCQRVASVRRNADRSFTEKRCMTRVVVRHPAGGRCRELMSFESRSRYHASDCPIVATILLEARRLAQVSRY